MSNWQKKNLHWNETAWKMIWRRYGICEHYLEIWLYKSGFPFYIFDQYKATKSALPKQTILSPLHFQIYSYYIPLSLQPTVNIQFVFTSVHFCWYLYITNTVNALPKINTITNLERPEIISGRFPLKTSVKTSYTYKNLKSFISIMYHLQFQKVQNKENEFAIFMISLHSVKLFAWI